jgi:hypothetical protein
MNWYIFNHENINISITQCINTDQRPIKYPININSN